MRILTSPLVMNYSAPSRTPALEAPRLGSAGRVPRRRSLSMQRWQQYSARAGLCQSLQFMHILDFVWETFVCFTLGGKSGKTPELEFFRLWKGICWLVEANDRVGFFGGRGEPGNITKDSGGKM